MVHLQTSHWEILKKACALVLDLSCCWKSSATTGEHAQAGSLYDEDQMKKPVIPDKNSRHVDEDIPRPPSPVKLSQAEKQLSHHME